MSSRGGRGGSRGGGSPATTATRGGGRGGGAGLAAMAGDSKRQINPRVAVSQPVASVYEAKTFDLTSMVMPCHSIRASPFLYQHTNE
jgi:hypothetical protein